MYKDLSLHLNEYFYTLNKPDFESLFDSGILELQKRESSLVSEIQKLNEQVEKFAYVVEQFRDMQKKEMFEE